MPTRLTDLAKWKKEGRRWAMLTAYDFSTARELTAAGIEVLLVGDSAANVVYGYRDTQQVSLDEITYLTAAVVRGAGDALVVADLPFGTYEASDEQAVKSATELMGRTGAHAVKIEGGERIAPRIAALAAAGVPVFGHIGFTPQSVHQLGGFKVQGCGNKADDQLRRDARAVARAGASAMVLEMVPAPVARDITREVDVPTIGIGAGPDTDAQVLVWADAAGFPSDRKAARFVHRFAEAGQEIRAAASRFKEAVEAGTFPDATHSFRD